MFVGKMQILGHFLGGICHLWILASLGVLESIPCGYYGLTVFKSCFHPQKAEDSGSYKALVLMSVTRYFLSAYSTSGMWI